MKISISKTMLFAMVLFLASCEDAFLVLSNIRVKTIDRLDAEKMIPHDQNLPFNVRQSASISVINFDYEKEAIENFPNEGGIMKVELLECEDGSLLSSSFIYANKENVSLGANKKDVLVSADDVYFLVDNSMVGNGCFRVVFRSMARSARSDVYRIR